MSVQYNHDMDFDRLVKIFPPLISRLMSFGSVAPDVLKFSNSLHDNLIVIFFISVRIPSFSGVLLVEGFTVYGSLSAEYIYISYIFSLNHRRWSSQSFENFHGRLIILKQNFMTVRWFNSVSLGKTTSEYFHLQRKDPTTHWLRVK